MLHYFIIFVILFDLLYNYVLVLSVLCRCFCQKVIKTCSVQKHNYILEPVGAQAKMSRNRSALPLRSVERPRLNVNIMLDALPIRLSDTQFHGLATMVAELDRHNRRKRFRHLRPHCKVTDE